MSDIIELSPAGEFVQSSGDARIYVRSWHPSHDSTCVVVIVPGFNSHAGHYQWVAEQLDANGVAVYAVDLRGRGRSDGERFFVAKFSDYVDDVAAAVALAKSLEPGLPIFLLGHSAGGVVACFYALQHQDDFAGLICESFSYELPAPDFALAALKGLSHILPHAHVVRLKNEDFSRDPTVVRTMNEDSLTIGEVQPTQTIAEMTRAGERLKELFARITLPVLILHGTADKVAKPSGSQHFYAAAGSSDKTLKLYEGHFHDLLNDIGKDAVISDISLWIDSRLQHRSVAELAQATSA
jgi:alpha-beta hydrolase superfamily lysophospholipase